MPKYFAFKICGYYLYFTSHCVLECMHAHASDEELTHMLIHHPEMFDRLIEWEHEGNVFHRRLTRRETPSEVKARLLEANRHGFPAL